jgi:hypothetical protein
MSTPEGVYPSRRNRKKPPMQPVVLAKDGCVRFQANRLVVALLDAAGTRCGLDLNWLARLENIPSDDREQFTQLIGYSVSGAPIGDKARRSADRKARALSKGSVR